MSFHSRAAGGAPGEVAQVSVRLPKNALIARTEVLVDSADKGNGKNWSECDVNDKTRAIGGAHIVRFHRGEQELWQELAVDVRNDDAEARFVKLKVLFQPQNGKNRSGCSRNNPQCGFASNLSQ